MAPDKRAGGLMTLRDIAALGGVSRPVVTTWRRRPVVRGVHLPFPSPVDHQNGAELFDIGAVARWFEETGRGNNPDFRDDLPAHIQPPALTVDGVDGMQAAHALLALQRITGAMLSNLDQDDVVDLADQADPDDNALFTEVEMLGSDLRILTRYVDGLVEASYGAEAAERVLRTQRERAVGQAGRAVTLTPTAERLVGRLVSALAVDLTTSQITLVDAADGGSELITAALRDVGEALDCTLVVAGGDTAARWRRRQALIAGLPLGTAVREHTPAVVLGQFPHRGRTSMSAGEILSSIDDLQLELEPQHRAVVLAPAAVLCDRLDDPEVERHRDHLLRGLQRLRAVVRLPAGLVLGKSREHWGLWVLGPPPDVRSSDKPLVTADLSDTELADSLVEDLVSDLVAAVAPVSVIRAHAFRFARTARTSDLLAARTLVPPGAAPAGAGGTRPGEMGARIDRLRHDLQDRLPVPVLKDVAVRERTAGSPGDTATLGELRAQGKIAILSGFRGSTSGLRTGTVRVYAVETMVDGPTDQARVDPVDLEHRHPRARRTEPGDVVFTTTPRPAAAVDRTGFAAVRSPARILRIRSAPGLAPEVLAAAINALPSAARGWRGWRIPLVDPAQRDLLAQVLVDLDQARADAQQRADDIAQLSGLLLDGVSSGSVALVRDPSLTDVPGHPVEGTSLKEETS